MANPSPTLRKALGQHHLRDPSLCRPLVEFLRPTGERVVEVGPGGGVLTRALVDAGARVLALELDPAWAVELRRRLPEVRVAVVDAATYDWSRLPSSTLVAGNLPFNVGTRIVERVLPAGDRVPRAGFMLQKEVADRLVAGPGDEAYGSLSVIVRAWAHAVPLGIVKPGSFHPPPKVAAAFVGLELHEPPLPREEMDTFARLVRDAFGLRRKTLRNSLKAAWGKDAAHRILEAAGLDPRRRAETLDLDDYLALYRARRGERSSPTP